MLSHYLLETRNRSFQPFLVDVDDFREIRIGRDLFGILGVVRAQIREAGQVGLEFLCASRFPFHFGLAIWSFDFFDATAGAVRWSNLNLRSIAALKFHTKNKIEVDVQIIWIANCQFEDFVVFV